MAGSHSGCGKRDPERQPKSLTPQQCLDIVLRVVKNYPDYVQFCTVLTAYAESDFKWNAKSKNPTSSGYYSEGIFQQTLPWWTNDHWDVEASTRAFLGQFRTIAGSAVKDCWLVQRWNAPDFRQDEIGFFNAKETKNYVDRQLRVYKILQTGQLPA
jgi:hypothetical protein